MTQMQGFEEQGSLDSEVADAVVTTVLDGYAQLPRAGKPGAGGYTVLAGESFPAGCLVGTS